MARTSAVQLFTGRIRPLPESGRPTGMYKVPIVGSAGVGMDGLVGDEQADRRVHGGPEKALHLYPARHYAQLARQFPEAAARLVPGSLGENLSTAALDESDVRIGDIWQLGTARIQVCQPRNPCWKIDERFSAPGMAQFIAQHFLTGWYWRVLTPGTVNPGDELVPVAIADAAPTLHEALMLWNEHRPDLTDLARLANAPGIALQWQKKIDQRLGWLRNAGNTFM